MIDDLSAYHYPLTHLFSKPSRRAEWEQYRLSDSQVEFYREHGYVSGIRMLDVSQVERLRQELTELADPKHPAHQLFYEYHSNESTDPLTVLFHALGAWRIASGFHDVLWHPAFTVPASQLLEGSVRFWHDQLFCKPAHHGGCVAWHQDYSYWTRTTPLAHLSCWIGLDDATRENGCLQYVPGSHRWSLLPITGLADDMNAIQTVLSDEQKKQFKPVAIELHKGEAAFHHPFMVHGSFANTTNGARRAMVLNVCRDGVKSATDAPLLAGVPPIRRGEKLDGQFFPLLLDQEQVRAW